MLSAPIAAIEGSYTGHNIAIIGENYVNLCFRLGYHFNIIDAYCSDKERDNHIYFRFLGGASDISKRTRRAMLIEKILIEFDFRIKIRGDMVIARHSNLIKDDMIRILDILGRLVGFTRQLDVKLDSDEVVDYYAEAFLMGHYEIVANR
jgi:pyruvate,water dikinase